MGGSITPFYISNADYTDINRNVNEGFSLFSYIDIPENIIK
jgi:hypothetical protein